MADKGTWVLIDGKRQGITPGQTLIDLLRERGEVDPRVADPVAMASINGRRTDLFEPLTHEDQVAQRGRCGGR